MNGTHVEVAVHPDVLLDESKLRETCLRAASLPLAAGHSVRIVRRSIDARHGRVKVLVLAEVTAAAGERALARSVELETLSGEPQALIVGAGPAGLFCAERLAELGVRALILERGREVKLRRHDVAKLSQRGELSEDSNYCFGEGGAGTFSDGKLYTRSKKRGPIERVLRQLVAYGAPDDILIDARPHIGTNRLPAVVSRMRAALESAGQQVRFGARVTGLVQRGARVCGVQLADGEMIEARAVVLATGHSADDVYRMLHAHGVSLEPKPFALGVRVEHAQALIDRAQYGQLAGHPALGSASYRLVEQVGSASVFSFCMCPGGFIVPASTLSEHQVVNGWSPSSRRGRYANSGLVTGVGPREIAAFGLDPSDPFAGLTLQRKLEHEAYLAGGGGFVAPAQQISDFASARASTRLAQTSYPRGVVPARLDRLLGPLAEPLRAAIGRIDGKLRGFAGPDAVAVGLESRTSAPLRIVRHAETLEAPSAPGLYPCAEGAGFAGGIVSAALDGLRVADAIARVLRAS